MITFLKEIVVEDLRKMFKQNSFFIIAAGLRLIKCARNGQTHGGWKN